MESIKAAAKVYGGLKEDRDDFDEQYFNGSGCAKYDAFLAGAMAPETEAYYKSKFFPLLSSAPPVGPLLLADYQKAEVRMYLEAGKKLAALKLLRGYFPNYSLRQCYTAVNNYEKELKVGVLRNIGDSSEETSQENTQ